MNPYDANTHPGTHLVAETLDVTQVTTLNTTSRPGEPLYRAATQVIGAAYELDELHSRVTHAAKDALQLLEPVSRAEPGSARVSYALLRTAVPELGDLLAQQGRAYDHLVESVSAYQRLLPEPDSADDDWAVAGKRPLMALEAVEAGGVQFRRTGIGDDPYVSQEKPQKRAPAIWPQTAQRLVAEGLLHQDTSANVYRPGQLLSLTPQGEAALRDARSTSTRVSAALGRSTTPANSRALADSADVPVARTSPTSSRSR
ncbi:large ATP-binding protein [Streptomyces boluensis]|uniref:Large ATP-binding protein n=1 Tax=Streptomyces boluensis TaxID=1775135 RepID=A0A964UN17_9ACTN|nr:large ATP-binding protein [Streptomyces boluensis]NBE51642.1 large ATP-binding protein [Streptomyces boluensis]